MAQINLLKQNKATNFNEGSVLDILVKLALVLVLAAGVYYGWIFLQGKKTNQSISELQVQINQQKEELAKIDKRDQVLTRQAQLKAYDSLISQHVYWSQLLPELAKVTLKNASFLSFSAENEGTISLSLEVADMAELDKFLQALDSPTINKYFRDVKIGGLTRVLDKENTSIRVEVRMAYNPILLQFQSVQK